MILTIQELRSVEETPNTPCSRLPTASARMSRGRSHAAAQVHG